VVSNKYNIPPNNNTSFLQLVLIKHHYNCNKLNSHHAIITPNKIHILVFQEACSWIQKQPEESDRVEQNAGDFFFFFFKVELFFKQLPINLQIIVTDLCVSVGVCNTHKQQIPLKHFSILIT